MEIETERLRLRDWKVGDDGEIDAMHVLGTDPKVMATLGPLLTCEQTAAMIARLDKVAQEQGHTFWACERKDDGRVIGFVGMYRTSVGPIAGEIEIGWRLAWDCWGKGYATEAARATIEHARAIYPGAPIYAITAVLNHRSQAVMQRLGMERVEEMDFDHPRIPAGSPLEPHVTYRIDT
ncbi:GNAT family N-acetyltransferase [Croceicoccus sediminis]|uniref:GNAT family N-acetyltransferase n=1 Tax=Croceicoccus sediminis TaxID=2571150 RepID=UPI001183D38F|nr:GNAT family N-acetyltransferase [Croceicoccus sediminis]